MNKTRSFTVGATVAFLISWGCTVAGDVQDAGAQGSGVTHEHLSVACGDVTETQEDGDDVVVLVEGVADTDSIVGLTYGGRRADGSFIGTSGVPVIADDGRIFLRGTFATSFSCDDRTRLDIVVARVGT